MEQVLHLFFLEQPVEQMERVEEDEEMEGKDKMAEKNGEEMPERDDQEIKQEALMTPQRYLFCHQ
jgi:hypothetical protein